MEEALRGYLLATAGVTALVAERVVWGERPQGDALPAIVLNLTGSPDQNAYDGPTGFVGARVQVECWAKTYLAARNVGRLVRGAAKAIRGIRGDVRFDAAFVDRQFADSEVTEADGRLFRRSIDLIVWHVEP